jgi:hypothetical protein
MNPKPYFEAFGILAFVALSLFLFREFWGVLVIITLVTIGVLAVTRKK